MDILVPNKQSIAKTLVEFRRLPYFSEIYTDGFSEARDDETGILVDHYVIVCRYGDNPYLSQPEEEAEAADGSEQPVSDEAVVEE